MLEMKLSRLKDFQISFFTTPLSLALKTCPLVLLSSITHLEHTSVCSHSWLLLHWWPLRGMASRKPTDQETLSPFSQERTETCVFPHPMFLSKFFTLVTHLTLNAHLCVIARLDWDFQPYIYMHTHTPRNTTSDRHSALMLLTRVVKDSVSKAQMQSPAYPQNTRYKKV